MCHTDLQGILVWFMKCFTLLTNDIIVFVVFYLKHSKALQNRKILLISPLSVWQKLNPMQSGTIRRDKTQNNYYTSKWYTFCSHWLRCDKCLVINGFAVWAGFYSVVSLKKDILILTLYELKYELWTLYKVWTTGLTGFRGRECHHFIDDNKIKSYKNIEEIILNVNLLFARLIFSHII